MNTTEKHNLVVKLEEEYWQTLADINKDADEGYYARHADRSMNTELAEVLFILNLLYQVRTTIGG